MRTSSNRRVVVITGASAGVGRATAVAFARRSATVALLARGRDGLEGARADVERAGGRAFVAQVDVSDAAAVEVVAGEIESACGPIDVWVNNAMVSVFAPAIEITPTEYQRVTAVTYLGSVYGTLAALRRMRPRDGGVIVQVGSALAYRSIPLQAAYCAAKHALVGFTDSLRSELIHDGSHVRLAVVHLPGMNTPQFEWTRSRLPRRAQPVPPIYDPDVAAEAIVWASEHDRREVWVGGPTVRAIVGQRIVPGVLDRYLATRAYEGQQTREENTHHAPDNFDAPVPGDHGARGRFRNVRHSSLQTWLARRRGALVVGAAVAGAVGFAVARRRVR